MDLAWRFALPEALVLVLAGILYFWNAFRYTLPVGYGGLFGLMSEKIAAQGFVLPASIPFYGPGGIPFAYPPVGLYVAALVERFGGIPYLEYARWQPAIMSVAFAVMFYWLARLTLGSRGKALVAVVVVVAAGEVSDNQVTASGVVRSLAGFWMVASCIVAIVAYRASRHRIALVVGAGLLFGLILATHLSYAVVGGLGILAFGLAGHGGSWWRRGSMGAAILAIGILAAAPWWATVLVRHGSVVFTRALQTHGNTGVMIHAREGLLQMLRLAASWCLNVGIRWSPLPLLGLTLAGLGLGIVRGNWALVSWFFVVLLFTGEPDRYLAMIGALLIGDLVGDWVRPPDVVLSPGATARWLRCWLAAALVLSVVYWQGLRVVRAGVPVLTPDTFSLGEWFRDETPSDTRFLLVSSEHDLAEWMPFLLRRTPTTAPWGSEWTGRSGIESARFGKVGECADSQSLDCVESFLAEENVVADYLVVPSSLDRLVASLESDPSWEEAYSNSGFLVFGGADHE